MANDFLSKYGLRPSINKPSSNQLDLTKTDIPSQSPYLTPKQKEVYPLSQVQKEAVKRYTQQTGQPLPSAPATQPSSSEVAGVEAKIRKAVVSGKFSVDEIKQIMNQYGQHASPNQLATMNAGIAAYENKAKGLTGRMSEGFQQGMKGGQESFNKATEEYKSGKIGALDYSGRVVSSATEGLGFGVGNALYSGFAQPLVSTGITAAEQGVNKLQSMATPEQQAYLKQKYERIKLSTQDVGKQVSDYYSSLSPETQSAVEAYGKGVAGAAQLAPIVKGMGPAIESGMKLADEGLGIVKPVIQKYSKQLGQDIGTHFEKAAVGFARRESGLSGAALMKADKYTKNAGYDGVEDYMLQNKFPLGKPDEMYSHADSLFKNATKEAKPEIISKIQDGFKTSDNIDLIDAIDSTLKGGSPESRAIKAELKALREKPYLTAQEQERIRALGDKNLKLKYSPEGDTGTVFDNQKLMDAARKRLSDADPTGVLAKKNAEIQALYKMKGALEKVPYKGTAKEFYLQAPVRLFIKSQLLTHPVATVTAKVAEKLVEKAAKEINATSVWKWAKSLKGEELSLVKRLQREAIDEAKDTRILDPSRLLESSKAIRLPGKADTSYVRAGPTPIHGANTGRFLLKEGNPKTSAGQINVRQIPWHEGRSLPQGGSSTKPVLSPERTVLKITKNGKKAVRLNQPLPKGTIDLRAIQKILPKKK